jgi:tetratricopeptide (TPR) repeat protein
MSAPKKPRRKTKAPAGATGAASSPLRHRALMDRFLAALEGRRDESAIEKAQDLIYEAWEQSRQSARVALARKALGISPLCADAFNVLADAAKSPEEAQDLYARALEAAELALGPEGFQEYEGHFWGFLETRPYMRAKAGLAQALQQLGEDEAAITHYRDMLRLNPNDNQGIRYVLAACLLRRGDDDALKDVLAAYPDEYSTYWLYTQALLAFRERRGNDEGVVALARAARAENRHVPALLAGSERPIFRRDGYTTVGGLDEGATTSPNAGRRGAAPREPCSG